jgi:phospholipase C
MAFAYHGKEISRKLSYAHFLLLTSNNQTHQIKVVVNYSVTDPSIINNKNMNALLGKDDLCGHAPAGAYQDRCGYGPRLPFLVISPYAKVNFVDHSIIDQSSIIRFIEDNWGLRRIGNQSFDEKAGSMLNMFNFTSGGHRAENILLDSSTGAVVIMNK